jgi:hypothetical protein
MGHPSAAAQSDGALPPLQIILAIDEEIIWRQMAQIKVAQARWHTDRYRLLSPMIESYSELTFGFRQLTRIT